MEKTFETKEVVIKKLVTEGLQIRVEMNEDCINDYAEIYRTWDELERDDDKLPPITVFYDVMGDEYYLADGFHRVIAAKRAGWEKITANVYEGTFNEALKFAVCANAEHGLQRTKADETHAMEIVWTQWDTLYKNEPRTTKDGRPSIRQLMRICSVKEHIVRIFINKYGVCESHTPPSKPTISKVTGRELVSLSEHTKNAIATRGNRHHLEERNKTVSALLDEGKDRFGVEIPARLRQAFMSCSPAGFIQDLGALRKSLFEDHKQTGDIAFAHCIDYALRDLDATIHALRNGQAFCVCRMCRGKGCGSCSNFGFQTKLQYQRVPREYKAEQV